MSLFGASLNKPTGGGLFGSLNTNTQPQTGSGLFGSNTQQNQQPAPVFGSSFGQNTQNQQQQQPPLGGSLFGGTLGQSTQAPQQSTGLFGGLGQSQQQQVPQQSSGGLFGGLGQSQQQNQQNQTQQGGGLFGGFGQSNQQQQQQPQQGGMFSQSSQQPLPQLGQSTAMWQPNSGFNPREKSIPEQIAKVLEQWDTGNPNCAFKYYFYNKVEPNMAPYYRPDANEDPKAWEEALSNKPGPAYIPVLCIGFAQLGKRIEIQQQNLAGFNSRLHEINNALSRMMQDHETKTSVRAIDARRKHLILKQRCLALATRVQVLRNRGYALGGDEEDLRIKLSTLEKHVYDPGLHAKDEEIWARMVTVRERANILKNEIEKSGHESFDTIDDDTARRAKKILEDYETQLRHLKDELMKIHSEYNELESERGGLQPKSKQAPKFDAQSRPLQFV